MGDIGEYFEGHREAQQERRAKRLPVRTDQILALRREGYSVEAKTPYQFRVDGAFDLYPIHNRWHDLRTNKRGGAKDLADFIRRTIPARSVA